MQSWRMRTTDTGAELELHDAPLPAPGADQLLVRMHTAGLNRGEFIAGHGLHGATANWKSVGSEGAGEVVALGAHASRWHAPARSPSTR
jgi:NADPH:quinone reductase-like Zn-dependent oxidoreductase